MTGDRLVVQRQTEQRAADEGRSPGLTSAEAYHVINMDPGRRYKRSEPIR